MEKYGGNFYCNETTGYCQDTFTDCLVENCNNICKEYGTDEGYYYKENKCWCDEYTETCSFSITNLDSERGTWYFDWYAEV